MICSGDCLCDFRNLGRNFLKGDSEVVFISEAFVMLDGTGVLDIAHNACNRREIAFIRRVDPFQEGEAAKSLSIIRPSG